VYVRKHRACRLFCSVLVSGGVLEIVRGFMVYSSMISTTRWVSTLYHLYLLELAVAFSRGLGVEFSVFNNTCFVLVGFWCYCLGGPYEIGRGVVCRVLCFEAQLGLGFSSFLVLALGYLPTSEA
jgi:hypothetical protein